MNKYLIHWWFLVNGSHVFSLADEFQSELPPLSNKDVEESLGRVQSAFGVTLPVDPKTNFPSFVFYEWEEGPKAWTEIGGG